jgi:hypothetical protein
LLGTIPVTPDGTKAVLTTRALPLGVHGLTAQFNGDGRFNPATSNPVIQAVHNAAFFAIGGSNGRVQVRKAKPEDDSIVADFMPYGPGYTGGATVALGDVTGDGYDDLVTGAAAGNPHVKVYNGAALGTPEFSANPEAFVIASFFPHLLRFNVGATVAVGDVNGDGYGDVVTGASVGNPQVLSFDGQAIASGAYRDGHAAPPPLGDFYAKDIGMDIGVTVGLSDFENRGSSDVLTGTTNGTPMFRVTRGTATGKDPPSVPQGTLGDFPASVTYVAA